MPTGAPVNGLQFLDRKFDLRWRIGFGVTRAAAIELHQVQAAAVDPDRTAVLLDSTFHLPCPEREPDPVAFLKTRFGHVDASGITVATAHRRAAN